MKKYLYFYERCAKSSPTNVRNPPPSEELIFQFFYLHFLFFNIQGLNFRLQNRHIPGKMKGLEVWGSSKKQKTKGYFFRRSYYPLSGFRRAAGHMQYPEIKNFRVSKSFKKPLILPFCWGYRDFPNAAMAFSKITQPQAHTSTPTPQNKKRFLFDF